MDNGTVLIILLSDDRIHSFVFNTDNYNNMSIIEIQEEQEETKYRDNDAMAQYT